MGFLDWEHRSYESYGVDGNEHQWHDLWFGRWTWLDEGSIYRRSIVLKEQSVINVRILGLAIFVRMYQ